MHYVRALLALSVLTAPTPASAVVNDPAFVESSFIAAPAVLTGIEWAPDGSERLFVLRKQGQVHIVENGVLLAEPFATLSPIYTQSECGLIGMAFDPDFIDNGYVYFFVTVSAAEQQIIRFTAGGNVGTDKTVVLGGLPTAGTNHNGGALGFGPDGKLYWAIGDNGGARLGIQNDLTLLNAKVGRANRDGSVPGDNPFFDGDGPNNDYVWARGFRNPFTLTFQPAAERLWLSVVGTGYEQVFMLQAGDHGGYNWHESNQVPPFVAPAISYRTNKNTTWTIAAGGAVRTAGVTTVATVNPHRLRPGAKVTIAGMADSSFDGDFFVAGVPALTQFTYAQSAAADATSGGATVQSQLLGGAVTGGAFWDSSAPPADYRGNFMFGDYNSGKLIRATLDGENRVASVDEWGNGITRAVDVAVGPDGDLYYAGTGGEVFRARHASVAQGLVISRLNVRAAEAGSVAFNVRFAAPLTSARAVTIRRSSGDEDIAVEQGASLRFDAGSWASPQRVVLSAAADVDSLDDTAVVRVASSGLTAQLVRVRVTDDESFSLIVSPNALSLLEGSTAVLLISLTEPPSAALEVEVGLDGDPSVSVDSGAKLTFDASNWSQPQVVLVAASEDVDALAGVATLTVSGDGLATRQVEVAVDDNDSHAPLLLTQPVTQAIVGATYRYQVVVDALPEATLALEQAPAGMTIDPTAGVVEWVPQATGVELVSIRASNGIDPDATQSFELVVVADQAPSCSLTAPTTGAIISGTMAELFGDVFDDVSPTKAEFSIDGALTYEDVNDDGHYHLGGTHNQFDTTLLTDGEHVLAMTGYDSSGQTCVAEVTVTVANGSGEGDAGAGGEAGATSATGGEATQPEPPAAGQSGVAGANANDGGEPSAVESAAGGAAGATPEPGAGSSSTDDGCSCRATGASNGGAGPWQFGLLALLGWLRRRQPGLRRG